MTRLPRPCLDCGRATKASRCARCRAARDHVKDLQRGSRHARGYDTAWERLARAAVAAQPWCTDCGTPGTPDNPLSGDHLRWPARTLADVAVRCRVHNSRKGAARFRQTG